MSQRSIRRAQQRRQAKERRRELLSRRRASFVASAALGAALFAPAAANAANLHVTTDGDTNSPTACDVSGDCTTLRDALYTANQNGEDDTITFDSGLSGHTITLTDGDLGIDAGDGALAIQGLGAGNLTIMPEAGSYSRIFNVFSSGNPVSISGLTLTGGNTDGSDGGAVFANSETDVTISGSTLTNNTAGSGYGGAVYSEGSLTLSGTTVSNNTGRAGGGVMSSGKYGQLHVHDSTITSNEAQRGGGVDVAQSYKYSYANSNVKHAVKSDITNTSISANKADLGAGVNFDVLGDGDHFTITHSTISGNDAASSEATGYGGGIHFSDAFFFPYFNGEGYNYRNITPIDGEFRAIDSTISGNSADVGGGVSMGGAPRSVLSKAKRLQPYRSDPYGTVVGPDGSVDFENSTIASNSASSNGGGVYLNQYDTNPYDEQNVFSSPTIGLTSTILADNTAGGAPNDADRGNDSQSGGLDSVDSLVENAGDAPFTNQQSTLTGIDPQLGPLADNGGPTQTQLPSTTSPVIDKGDAPARLNDDQRGQSRTVQGDAADAPGGDGTDIGAVEVQNPAKSAPVVAQQQVLGDRTPPRITLRVPKSLSIRQLIRGFNVRVNCNEPCSMTFRLYGSAPTGTLHSSGFNFRLLNRKIGRKAGSRTVGLRPCVAGSPSSRRTHVCRNRITAALYAKPQKSFKVKLIVAAKDAAGNTSHTKRFIRVHR